MTRSDNYRIAYFISPHGFGHAARAVGVMEALCKLEPKIVFEIYTQVPEWFFEEILTGRFEYHSLLTDIGLVQKTPLRADLSATLRRLNRFLPFDPFKIRELARVLNERRCQFILCDISPMGIAVARTAGIPSVLIENFTWDWLYQEYVKEEDRIAKHSRYLKKLFKEADFHIQTAPVCEFDSPDLFTSPVSRRIKAPTHQIRNRLGVKDDTRMVMITMGGIPDQYPFLERLKSMNGIVFIIPGVSEVLCVRDNLFLLPHHSECYHPDLLNACDGVIGKVGYSTLAEVYYAGIPFGYVARTNFRESKVLVSYIENQMEGMPIGEDEFYTGEWISGLPDLLALPRIERQGPSGAMQIARFIHSEMG